MCWYNMAARQGQMGLWWWSCKVALLDMQQHFLADLTFIVVSFQFLCHSAYKPKICSALQAKLFVQLTVEVIIVM